MEWRECNDPQLVEFHLTSFVSNSFTLLLSLSLWGLPWAVGERDSSYLLAFIVNDCAVSQE